VDQQRRVVITGFGLVSPLGLDVELFWQRLVGGESAIRPFVGLPLDALAVHCGGQCVEFTGAAEEYGPIDGVLKRNIRKNQKVMAREIEMGVAAAQRSIFHSGIAGLARDPDRYGVSFASDLILTRPEEFVDGVRGCFPDGVVTGPVDLKRWPDDGLTKVNPLWLLKYLPNMPASHVAIFNDFRGPNNSLTVREAGNNIVLGESISVIRRGWADCMVVGATGSRIHPLRSVHTAMQEPLAAQRVNPAEMCRPFDRSRDGIVLGEGAGAVVLERLDLAQQRGAKIWGEVVGAASSMSGPIRADNRVACLRRGLVNAMEAALRQAGSLPNALHIHAHGAGTPEGDLAEQEAISEVCGRAGLGDVPVVAAKGHFGSLGAGSAAVELVSSLLALDRGHLFGVANYRDQEGPVVKIAKKDDPSGDAFIHLSYTPQGQVSAVIVKRFAP
jgi:3-oxoacyl-[acyl-carrier-protein] synthase II